MFLCGETTTSPERPHELRDGWAIVAPLRPRVDDGRRGVDDEIAAQLQGVRAGTSQARAARKLARIVTPDLRIAPDAQERPATEPPGPVGDALSIDEHRVGNLEPVQQRAAQPLRRVEGDEDRGAELVDPLPLVEHLHEVRAADQSARVAEKDQQEGPSAQVVEAKVRSFQVDEIDRSGLLADARRSQARHAARPPTPDRTRRQSHRTVR